MKDLKQFQAQNMIQTFNKEGNLSGEHILKEAIDLLSFYIFKLHLGAELI